MRMFENKMLRRIFGPKREEVTGCRKLHNEKLHNLYLSQHIIRMIKPRRLRQVGVRHEISPVFTTTLTVTFRQTDHKIHSKYRLWRQGDCEHAFVLCHSRNTEINKFESKVFHRQQDNINNVPKRENYNAIMCNAETTY
jgi:hypothetical protein